MQKYKVGTYIGSKLRRQRMHLIFSVRKFSSQLSNLHQTNNIISITTRLFCIGFKFNFGTPKDLVYYEEY